MREWKSHRFQHGGRKIQTCMRCKAQRRWNDKKSRYQYRTLTVPAIATSYGAWWDETPKCYVLDAEPRARTLEERIAELETTVDALKHDLRAARDRIADLESGERNGL